MFTKFFWGEEEHQTELKKKENSSTNGTTGTDDTTEEKGMVSPKREFEEFLQQTNSLQEALRFRISQRKDDYRTFLAYKDGGLICEDPHQVYKLRSVGKEMIKIIGRKILSGSLNLTKISFPIRACYPKTALYNSIASCSTFPYFMSEAAAAKDPLQRFKIVLACLVSAPYYINMFLKPLNPILGETLQASLVDGTRIYAEQISHHPPITYFLVYGPKEEYQFSGYYDFQISPGLNSLTLKNVGKRRIVFRDGGIIEATYPANEFSGTFFGTTRIEESDKCSFHDWKHELHCQIEFDKVKRHASDYINTLVMHKNKPVSKLVGTYCGYLDFDGVRYWDGRDVSSLHIQMTNGSQKLPSDWSHRKDIKKLLTETDPDNFDEAQLLKETLEEDQRHDAKLRKKHLEYLEEIRHKKGK